MGDKRRATMNDEPPSNDTRLSPRLRRTDDELRIAFRKLNSVADVAELLEVGPSQLTYALWRMPDCEKYASWTIRKRSGGTRTISAPLKTHRILQQKLAYILSLVAQRRTIAHGFVPARSISTNASPHLRSYWILNIDIKDFFPSINFGRIRGMLMSRPYQIGQRAATAIAQLCCYESALPQGAPTSPVLSNMICAKLDGELRRLAEQYSCKCTRYVDDITFSTRLATFPPEIAEIQEGSTHIPRIGSSLARIIEANGFSINPDKTRLQSKLHRQEVTGIIVNRRLNLRRSFSSQVRAMLHAWERYGYDAAQSRFLEKYDTKHRPSGSSARVYERVIQGKLAFMKQIRGGQNGRYIELHQRFLSLLGKIESPSHRAVSMNYDVFLCHSSKDKETVVNHLEAALASAGVRVWLDAKQIAWGDNIVEKINEGLAKSKFVILVLSPAFVTSKWPVHEMNSVLSREITSGVPTALPLIVGTAKEKEDILSLYPLLAAKRYLEWSAADVGSIVTELKGKIQISP
jgi:RNA-directed DNA polymerase